MKLSILFISLLTAVIALPALACGPVRQVDHEKRQTWVKKRIHHLNQQEEIDRHVEILDGYSLSTEVMRQRVINRIEYMMLKKERGVPVTERDKAYLRRLLAQAGLWPAY